VIAARATNTRGERATLDALAAAEVPIPEAACCPRRAAERLTRQKRVLRELHISLAHPWRKQMRKMIE
jgi:hypothetical protein